MLGIAVTKACGGKSASVIVDNHRTEHNLVASVPVNVGYSEVMIALTIPGTSSLVAFPAPALGQSAAAHIQRHHLVAGVNTAGNKDARGAAVQVRRTEEMLRRAVAVAVAPCRGQVGLAGFQSLQRIFYLVDYLTGLAVQIEQILIALMHEPLAFVRASQIVLRGIADGDYLSR